MDPNPQCVSLCLCHKQQPVTRVKKSLNLFTVKNRRKHNYLKKMIRVLSSWRRSTAGGLQSQPSAWRRSSWLPQKMRGGKRNNSLAAERESRQQRTGFLHMSTDTTTPPSTPPTSQPPSPAAQFKGHWRNSRRVPVKLRLRALGEVNMCWHVITRRCAGMWTYGKLVMWSSTAALLKWCFNGIQFFEGRYLTFQWIH